MTYYSGFLLAVPTANKQKYIDMANAAWPMFKRYGALRMVEAWGVDVPRGKVNDFYMSTQAKDDETVVFSWIEWPDKATSDAAQEKMTSDPEMQAPPEMPFDGMRMMWGGFEPIVDVKA
ncbi:DUF1428 domain-containing protein [Paracoccus versutus]|uniref:Uncharacterized protein YbaA (DUF1428 family) n=1 Tax=Paracoccus versutus TaxID=34007 RepID=A0AAQ0HJV5_PARVE|nr:MULTISPECIES: DUF1428 domain-containing protein [Paracoccus]WGR60299.1 DUF1428 domain-containing protein [Paracoccus ferrooxidans]SFX58845.1 Uncharacterized conserved protein YbaA, DUF1428 family [Paracoccus pantotrophus]KGJ07512.1 RNA signal recognition particle 4.5S RNA [Paracoccus versutus]MBT0777981.1 DUF1428 family protein [Paracoccus sp. pheM1]MCJ1899396.1 DUF1428 domain-containing protein [Paracoccus versutus]